VETRTERIVLETAHHRIVGDLALPHEGYRSRLSDFLNRGELNFIPLVDVEIRGRETSDAVRREFVAVARSHVHLAYPYGDDGEPG
jgi:hypothetical protein